MMYSVDVIAASSSFQAADPTNVRLVFHRTDIYRPEFLDHDVIAAGGGFMGLDRNGVFYEKKSSLIAVPVISRRDADSASDELDEALRRALSQIGIEECVHPRLIYDLTQTCHARTGKWIVPASVSVKVDHRFPEEGPGTAQSVAGLPRKRMAVPPSRGLPGTAPSEEELPTKRRRIRMKGAENWPVANLLPEFDGVATTAAAVRKPNPKPESKQDLLWRMYRRRVVAVRTVPKPAPSPLPDGNRELVWRMYRRRAVAVRTVPRRKEI